jgi:hypothetical protein
VQHPHPQQPLDPYARRGSQDQGVDFQRQGYPSQTTYMSQVSHIPPRTELIAARRFSRSSSIHRPIDVFQPLGQLILLSSTRWSHSSTSPDHTAHHRGLPYTPARSTACPSTIQDQWRTSTAAEHLDSSSGVPAIHRLWICRAIARVRCFPPSSCRSGTGGGRLAGVARNDRVWHLDLIHALGRIHFEITSRSQTDSEWVRRTAAISSARLRPSQSDEQSLFRRQRRGASG